MGFKGRRSVTALIEPLNQNPSFKNGITVTMRNIRFPFVIYICGDMLSLLLSVCTGYLLRRDSTRFTIRNSGIWMEDAGLVVCNHASAVSSGPNCRVQ
jgi:hypothetical protein